MRGQCPGMDSLHKRIAFLGNIYTGDFTALPHKQRLAELFTMLDQSKNCPDFKDSIHVFLLRNVASLYRSEGDFVNAIKYYREIISFLRERIDKPSVNSRDLITMYFWLMVCYDGLNNVKEKLAAIDSCIEIATLLKSTTDIACLKALFAKVEYSYDIGDYHRCIIDAERCEKLAREYIKYGGAFEYRVGLPIVSSSQGWQVKALLQLKNYQQAEALLANKLVEYKKLGLVDYYGLIYQQLAQVQMNKGNYEDAIAKYNLAVKNEKEVGNNFNCKQNLKDLGYMLYLGHLKDPNKAMLCFRKALTYINTDEDYERKDVAESLDILADMANIFVQQGQFDSAFKYYQLAFDQLRPGTNEMDILRSSPEALIENKKIDYLTSLLIDKADAYFKKWQVTGELNSLREAIRIYKATDLVLNRIKLEQSEIQSKLFWRRSYRSLYEHAIEASYQLGSPEDAFYFFEAGRAVLLNDQISEQRRAGEKELLQQAQLQRQIMDLERKILTAEKSAAPTTDLQKELSEKRDQLDHLKGILKEKNPLYFQNDMDSIRVGLKDVRIKLLNDHQALLELFEGDDAVYSILVTPKQAYFHKINKPDFDSTVSTYLSFISIRGLLSTRFSDFTQTAHHLYGLIFQQDSLSPGRIIISPDGPYFPFEALVSDSRNPKSPVYFLNHFATSYTYSARYLMNDFEKNKAVSSGSFLGMAPVKFNDKYSLPALPESDLSLRLIGTYFNHPYELVKEEASRQQFLQHYSNYDIIQLYTHSSDTSDHGEPIIYFTDSTLYLSELIPEYKPSAQLIVLSACETGNGNFYQGEGVFSFNRAFAGIGIPTSIINLWAVDSKSTYKLTELFYKFLTTGLPPDIALQKAKLEFIGTSSKEKSLPYFWAATVLAGKTSAIDFDKKSPWMPWVLGGFLVIASAGSYWFWRHRKANTTI